MDDVVEWLLEGDPAIRAQVLRDLSDAPTCEVAAERERIATEGWGARLLAEQADDGLWDGGVYRPGWVDEERPFFDAWTATHFSLSLLKELDADPASVPVQQAVGRVRQLVRWDKGDAPYYEGETEPCVNGAVLGNAVWAGESGARVAERLLEHRLADGGWNCWDRWGAATFSFHSTLAAVEGLLAWERAGGNGEEIRAARLAGEELLLERSLLRRRSAGTVVDPRFTMTSFPTWWYYDVLRALEHMRLARPEGDARCSEAIELTRGKRGDDGRWRLEQVHMGPTLFEMAGEDEGLPSRWITLRALRVLRWWDGQTARSSQETAPESRPSTP